MALNDTELKGLYANSMSVPQIATLIVCLVLELDAFVDIDKEGAASSL